MFPVHETIILQNLLNSLWIMFCPERKKDRFVESKISHLLATCVDNYECGRYTEIVLRLRSHKV